MKNTDLLIMYKAMDSAREGITICDASQPDHPLIFVNKGFLMMTGYAKEEVLGKNCRFLQGKDTNAEAIKSIRQAIAEREPLQIELLNYRKNGEAFWNSLSITPVLDDDGELTHFIGIQDDITSKKFFDSSEQRISKQKLLTETAIEAQEKERKELGMELHDNINQILATIKLYLTIATQQEDQRDEMMYRVKHLTNNVIEEIRKLSKSLVGPQFEERTLVQALDDLVEDIKVAVPFAISISYCNFDESYMTGKQKLMLYRIVQEQTNNIIKYAKAEVVSISITKKEHELELKIIDDGIGFDPQVTTKGIGLKNISSRLELEDGNMVLQAAPGMGCRMIVTIPDKK